MAWSRPVSRCIKRSIAVTTMAFSRSYCYTVWSAIGIILYQRVPSRHVPICPFRHFCCRMYRLATKRTTMLWSYCCMQYDRLSQQQLSFLFLPRHRLARTIDEICTLQPAGIRQPFSPIRLDHCFQRKSDVRAHGVPLPFHYISRSRTADDWQETYRDWCTVTRCAENTSFTFLCYMWRIPEESSEVTT